MLLVSLYALAFQTQAVSSAEGIARACRKAFESKDKGWFERHLSAGFVYKDLEGERTGRAATLDKIGRWFHPLGYHVDVGLDLVSSRKAGRGLLLVSDLRVRSQLFGFHRMPLTEATVRVESFWLPKGGDWTVERIVEKSSSKTVDRKPVVDGPA